jgi:hypothetical protein
VRDSSLLIVERVQELPMADGRACLGDRQRRAPQERLEVQPTTTKAGRVVVNEPGFLGLLRTNVVELGEERGFLVTDELGQPGGPTSRPSALVCCTLVMSQSSSRTSTRAPGARSDKSAAGVVERGTEASCCRTGVTSVRYGWVG